MSSAASRRPDRMHVVLLRRGVEVGAWPVEIPADLRALDVLGRMQLCARRVGCTFVLRDLPDDLRGLLDFCGLADVFEDPVGATLEA